MDKVAEAAAAAMEFGVGTRSSGLDVLAVDDGNFNYGEKVEVEVSQKQGQDYWIRPVGGVVNQAGPFNFTIPPMDDKYIQLNRAQLYVRAKVVRGDGERLNTYSDIVAPVNLLGATMWERVEVQLNGQSFAGGTNINAGYKAYMETQLSYDTDGANTHLHTQFYHRDSPGRFGNMRVTEDTVRKGFRSAILDGALKKPAIPPHLEPDTNSDDYRQLSRRKYRDEDVLLIPFAEADPNDDGLDNPVMLARARQEEADAERESREREEFINDNADLEEELAMEEAPDDEPETEEQYRQRMDRNAQREERNKQTRKSNQNLREMAEAQWVQTHPMPERAKRRRRREIYREYAKEQLEYLDKFLYSQGEYSVNRGFDDRYNIISGSAPFDMMSPITHDIFRMDNHIAPGNRLDLRLTMYPHAFLLNSLVDGPGYKLVIEDLQLHYHVIERRERIQPPLREKYRFNETRCSKQIVSKDLPSFVFRLHAGGVLPKTVILGQVFAPAADGAYDYNPWHFHHFDTAKVEFIINGETYPQGGVTFDFNQPNPLVSRGYRWLFENTGATEGEKGNIISWQAYQAGSFLIPLDLTPDKCNGLHNHAAQYGYIDVQITWDMSYIRTRDPIYIVYETVHPKVLVNDRQTGQVFSLDVEGK